MSLIPGPGCSLSFLEDQGIDLIRPCQELAELQSQANSSMSEAEVLSALQVSISATSCIHVVLVLMLIVLYCFL